MFFMKKSLFIINFLSILGVMSTFAQENLQHLAQWTGSDFLSKYSEPGLPHDRVLRMWQTDDGKLCLATVDGIVIMSRQDEVMRKVKTVAIPNMQDVIPLSHNVVAVVSQDKVFSKTLDDNEAPIHFDCPAPLGTHFNQPLLAPLSEQQFLLAARDGTVWRFDCQKPNGAKVAFSFKPGKFTMARNPASGKVYAFSSSKLLQWQDDNFVLLTELPVSECYSINFSPSGEHIYFYQPLSAYEIATGKFISTSEHNQLYRWGMAVDVKNNVLYCAGWNALDAFWPADTPAKWQQINALMVTDQVPIYTHRALNPATNNGSVIYLQDKDEMLVACKLGITTLKRNTTGAETFPLKNDFRQLQFDNRSLAGNGDWQKFLRRQKLVAAWVSSTSEITNESMANYRRAGINTLLFLCFQIDHGQFYPPYDVRESIRKVSKLCRENDFQLIAAITPYNISINNSDPNFRRLVVANGEIGRYTRPPRNEKYVNLDFPCYHDQSFAERQGVIYQAREFALLAQEKIIDGLCFELGDGFGGTNISRSLCFCDACMTKFGQVPELPPPAERQRWLYNNNLYQAYESFQEQELAAICRAARTTAFSLAPGMELMVMLPEQTTAYQNSWFFNAFIGGFQLPDRPVTVFSEQTYGCPYMPQLVIEPVQAWQKRGWQTILIPGIVNYWLAPEQLRQRSQEYAQATAGIYYYHGYRWYQEKFEEIIQKPINKFDFRPPATLRQYIEAMSGFHPGSAGF